MARWSPRSGVASGSNSRSALVGTRSSCALTGARAILSNWSHGRENQSNCSARLVALSWVAVTSTSCSGYIGPAHGIPESRGVAGFESVASSSRSQLATWPVRDEASLIWKSLSIGVRWSPPLLAAIVIHLVTQALAVLLVSGCLGDRFRWVASLHAPR